MTRALIVVFHRNPPFVSDNYKIMFEYFKKELGLWANEITTLYIVSSNNYLQGEVALGGVNCKVEVYPTINKSHAQNLNFVFPNIKEDCLAIIDPDTIIYEKGILDKYFNPLDKYGVVSYIERPNLDEISRFCPYFFLAKKSIFEGIEVKFDENPPKFLDPLAELTHTLLGRGVTYHKVVDDRSSIYMDKEGVTTESPSPAFKTGIYHIRNFMGGVVLVDEWNTNREGFEARFKAMPPTEVNRLFGWLWTLNSLTFKTERLERDILDIVKVNYSIPEKVWLGYMQAFKNYHNYLDI